MGPGAEIPTFKEHSAFHVLKSVNNIDYSVSSTAGATDVTAGSPIGWSHSNALVFSRGNRVYYKTMADTEGVPSSRNGTMAIGRCVAPTPAISTRNCAAAGPAPRPVPAPIQASSRRRLRRDTSGGNGGGSGIEGTRSAAGLGLHAF